jgi:hypothetical protein
MAFVGKLSFTGSRISARQEILEVVDLPLRGGKQCDDEIFFGEEP